MSTKSPLRADQITGVILAGGQSRRMGGGDKFLKEINGKPIIDLIAHRFQKQLTKIIISANGDVEPLKSFNLPIVKDPIEGFAGPLAGILAAMNWAKAQAPESTHIISVAADTPLFPTDYVSQMIEQANQSQPETIILAKSQGRYHPIFGLWPISLKDQLEAELNGGLRKIRAWTDQCNNGVVNFTDQTLNGKTIDPFFNINEPKDFNLFLELMTD